MRRVPKCIMFPKRCATPGCPHHHRAYVDLVTGFLCCCAEERDAAVRKRRASEEAEREILLAAKGRKP